MSDWKTEAEMYKGIRPVATIDEAVNVARTMAHLVAHSVYVDEDLDKARAHFDVLLPAVEKLREFLDVSSRGPLSDEPRENENQDVAAPSVGQLEWDELEKGYISAGPFIIEQCIAGERRFISLGMDYPFPGEDWDAAKSLANSLQRILSRELE